jgi:hypothetical protein
MTWRAHSERIAWRSKAAPLAVAVAAIVACQLDHVGRQSFGILAAPRIHRRLRDNRGRFRATCDRLGVGATSPAGTE